jgi:DNA-binding response OmpR family regulator
MTEERVTPLKAKGSLKGKRLLIFEDEFALATATAEILTSLGCTIAGMAANVAAGLDLLRKETVDGAIVDMNLGGEWAIPLLEALKAKGVA